MQRMDEMVKKTQEYLNQTYSGNSNWVAIKEDGLTGWETIRGLIRALQIEIGISTPNGTFGPATQDNCPTLQMDLNPSDKTRRLVYILQGAMWCKGFSPGYQGGIFGDETEAGIKRFQASAGLAGENVNGIANPMIFKALLTMDAYVLVSSGDPKIREIQMNLNRDYYKWIGLRPTDGRYCKETNKALIYAIQVEEGIAEPNGTFGPATQSALPALAPGSKNTPFVKILQYALYCNRFDPTGFTGVFGNGTLSALKKFQSFCMLTADGYCGKQTWMSLMLSHGDRDRPGTACDCSNQITDARAKTLNENGYKIVGRYIAGGEWKKLKTDEAKILFKNGLRLFPIYQTSGNSASYFNSSQGTNDAREGIKSALEYGFPEGTIIYFAVDFDAVDDQVTTNILPHFRSIHKQFKQYNPKGYKIGIYGARNICSRVSDEGIAVTSFVGDLASGFSGNIGYPLPQNWSFDQIKEYGVGSGEGLIIIDKNIASGRDNGVDHLDTNVIPPNSSEEKELLKFASNTGLFTDFGVMFESFNDKILLGVPSAMPLITLEGEVSFVETLKGPHDTINFFNGTDTFTNSFVDSATNAGIDLEYNKITQNALKSTLSKLRITQSIGNVKYFTEFTETGDVSIVLETTASCQSPFEESKVLYIYHRLYLTIHKDSTGTFNTILLPIATSNSSEITPGMEGQSADNKMGLILFGLMLGGLAIIAIASGGISFLPLFVTV